MASTLAKALRSEPVTRLTLRGPLAVSPDAPVEQVVRRMAEQRTGCVLLHEHGRLVGIFTERDFVNRVVAAGREVTGTMRQVMTPDPVTLTRHDSVQKAVEVMVAGGYRHMPILDDDRQVMGVLSVKDIIHYLVEYFPAKVYNLPPTPDQTQPAREGA